TVPSHVTEPMPATQNVSSNFATHIVASRNLHYGRKGRWGCEERRAFVENTEIRRAVKLIAERKGDEAAPPLWTHDRRPNDACVDVVPNDAVPGHLELEDVSTGNGERLLFEVGADVFVCDSGEPGKSRDCLVVEGNKCGFE